MIKSLKQFWKDYLFYCKTYVKMIKNHWKGCVFLTTLSGALLLWLGMKAYRKSKVTTLNDFEYYMNAPEEVE